MSTMTTNRTASDELRRELQLGLAELPASANPTGHGVAAITVDPATGEIRVVCVCALLGYGRTESEARTDLSDAHGTGKHRV